VGYPIVIKDEHTAEERVVIARDAVELEEALVESRRRLPAVETLGEESLFYLAGFGADLCLAPCFSHRSGVPAFCTLAAWKGASSQRLLRREQTHQRSGAAHCTPYRNEEMDRASATMRQRSDAPDS